MKIIYSVFLCCFLFSCSREELPTNERNRHNFVASFSFSSKCNFFPERYEHTDTPILFTNQSFFSSGNDTISIKTYKWEFGDNTTSTEVNPVHIYRKTGFYTISLITFLNNQPSDTLTRDIQIIIGPKELRTELALTTSVDIAETAENGVLVLVSRSNSSVGYPSYSLIKVDSLFKDVWNKPVPGTNCRLNSLKRINAGEYILSGNYSSGNRDVFSISKIDSAGNLIWTKYAADIQGENEYTLPTSDNGFITIGNASMNEQSIIIVKFDSNGNEVWRKNFNGVQRLQSADNIIENTNGYIFASIIYDALGTRNVAISQLDFSGNLVQQTTEASPSGYSIFSAGIVHTDSTYLVYASNSRCVYLFSENLSLIRKNESLGLPNTGIINGADAKDGFFYIAAGSFNYSHASQLNSYGEENWISPIGVAMIVNGCLNNGVGHNRVCKKVLCTFKNEVIALSYGQNNPDTHDSTAAYLDRFRVDGSIK